MVWLSLAWTAAVESYINHLAQLSDNPEMQQRTEHARVKADEQWDAAQVALVWISIDNNPVALEAALTAQRVFQLAWVARASLEAKRRGVQLKELDAEAMVAQFRTGIALLRTQLKAYWDDIDRLYGLPSLRRWRLHRRIRKAQAAKG
jgi:hypothetical protein